MLQEMVRMTKLTGAPSIWHMLILPIIVSGTLCCCSNAKEIKIQRTNVKMNGVSDADLLSIPLNSEISSVDISDSPSITADGVGHLTRIRKLEELYLVRSSVDDRIASELSKCAGLTFLNVKGSPLGDEGLAAIAALTELRQLHVNECPNISDKGIAKLVVLRKLKILNLDGNRGVTDASVGHLCQIKALEYVRLVDTAVSTDGVNTLREKGIDVAYGDDE